MRTCSTPACSSAGGSIVGACPPEASCCSTSRPCGSATEAYVVGAVSARARPGRAHRRPAGAACSAPPRPAEPRRAPAVRDPPLGPLGRAVVLPRRGGRPADRDRAPAHRRGPRRGPGHHLGAGRSRPARPGSRIRGPGKAFRLPRAGHPGERDPMDLLPASPGSRRPPPVARGSPDEAPIDRQSLARFGTRSTAVAPLVEGGSVVGGLSVGTVLRGAPLARRADRRGSGSSPTSSPTRWRGSAPSAPRTRARSTSGTWPGG